jgi:hypothetical protein
MSCISRPWDWIGPEGFRCIRRAFFPRGLGIFLRACGRGRKFDGRLASGKRLAEAVNPLAYLGGFLGYVDLHLVERLHDPGSGILRGLQQPCVAGIRGLGQQFKRGLPI